MPDKPPPKPRVGNRLTPKSKRKRAGRIGGRLAQALGKGARFSREDQDRASTLGSLGGRARGEAIAKRSELASDAQWILEDLRLSDENGED